MTTLSDSPFSDATGVTNCLVLRTGRDERTAFFYPARYQLVIDYAGEQSKVELGYSGSRLLERLLQEPGEVVAREELMRYAWADRVVGQGSLNQQIYALRQILGDEKDRQIIQTLPRRGYLINPNFLRAPANSAELPDEADATPETAAPATPDAPPAPLAEPAPGTGPAAAATGWRKPLLLGGGAAFTLVLLALLLPIHFHGALASQEINLGQAQILYLSANEQQLQPLISSTRTLSRRLAQMVNTPMQLVLVANGDFYELLCLQPNGNVRWLMIHHDQLDQVADAQLRGCLP